jgi:1,4-dihydroxy-2-naphthoate octaprenyltransferase
MESLQALNSLQPSVSIHAVTEEEPVNTASPLVVHPEEVKRGFKDWCYLWWNAIRPGYLTLSLTPLLLGHALAWSQTITVEAPLGHLSFPLLVGSILAVVLIQAAAHLLNDYYDYRRGIDTGNSLGPSGMIQQGLVAPTSFLKLGLLLLTLGSVLGVLIAMPGGFTVIALGVIGVLCAFFYSATQNALSSLSLGEIITFLVFGPAMTLGAYLIQTNGVFTQNAFIYSMPLAFLATAVIYANNMRDFETDAQGGKHTLASLFGLLPNRIVVSLLLVAPYVLVAALAFPAGTAHFFLMPLWSLPSLVVAIVMLWRTGTPSVHHVLVHDLLRLERFFGGLLILAALLTAYYPIILHTMGL